MSTMVSIVVRTTPLVFLAAVATVVIALLPRALIAPVPCRWERVETFVQQHKMQEDVQEDVQEQQRQQQVSATPRGLCRSTLVSLWFCAVRTAGGGGDGRR